MSTLTIERPTEIDVPEPKLPNEYDIVALFDKYNLEPTPSRYLTRRFTLLTGACAVGILMYDSRNEGETMDAGSFGSFFHVAQRLNLPHGYVMGIAVGFDNFPVLPDAICFLPTNDIFMTGFAVGYVLMERQK